MFLIVKGICYRRGRVDQGFAPLILVNFKMYSETIGGLQKIAWASNIGVLAYEERIPIYEETKAVCKALNIDLLQTISSGVLIISAHPEKAEEIVVALKKKSIRASVIGKTVDKREGSYILRCDGTKLDLSKPVKEEL